MMKKLMLAVVMAVGCCAMAFAEQGDMSAGLQFNYASKNSMIGLGVNYQIEVVRNLRIEPEFIYYFENKQLSDYNVNLNVQYLIPTSSRTNIYPLAGFSYVSFKDHATDTSDNRYGANIGIGVEYMINQSFKFYTEQRFHIIKHWNESVTCLGLRYTF